MIIDRIENIMNYAALLPNIKNGIEKLCSLTELTPGRYRFDGGFFMIQKGMTRPITEGSFESHRKYIDVQIILEGSEEVAWEDIRRLNVIVPYDEEKDAQRLTGNHEHVMKITQGMFYAAFPQDGHQPVAHRKEVQSFTKIVMKLPVPSPSDTVSAGFLDFTNFSHLFH